jgi:hypothetical protein
MGDVDEPYFYSSGPAEGHAVCGECIDDDEIKKFIETQADSRACDFCGRKSRKRAIAAPLDEVVEFMFTAIDREYERAVEALGWESAEGGYQGSHWDSLELLTEVIGLDFPNDDDGRLLDILINCFGDEPWCKRDPYGQRKDEWLISNWDRFCKFIKHQRRYFFLQPQKKQSSRPHEHLTPSELLRYIGETVRRHRLVRTLPAGTLIRRARQQKRGEVFETPCDFGPPPVKYAVRSNRMSPAGIVMFYGSDDEKTAIAEIDDDPNLGIAVGTFRLTRKATVLDLTKLPPRVPFFKQEPETQEYSYDRYGINFLHSFVASMAAKVEPGEREHVDYVPTQVVTEWFRRVFRNRKSRLDGIYYPSTQRPGGTSIVLFANRYAVALTPEQIKKLAGTGPLDEWWLRTRHEKAWLELVEKQVVRRPQCTTKG